MDHSSLRRSRCFQSFLLLAFVVLAWGPLGTRSLRFELESGHTKCISEEININGMSVGKYSVIDPADDRKPHRPEEATANRTAPHLPDSHRVTVRVTSPYGTSIHYGERVELGNFAFTASESGDFMTCFWTPDHKPPVKVTVDFEWRTGMATKDWSNVAKKDQIDVMGLELRKMEDIVKTIHDEIFYLREREDQMQELNRSTNSRMAWLSFLSLVVCLSVASLQLWHLKTFFEKKKII